MLLALFSYYFLHSPFVHNFITSSHPMLCPCVVLPTFSPTLCYSRIHMTYAHYVLTLCPHVFVLWYFGNWDCSNCCFPLSSLPRVVTVRVAVLSGFEVNNVEFCQRNLQKSKMQKVWSRDYTSMYKCPNCISIIGGVQMSQKTFPVLW